MTIQEKKTFLNQYHHLDCYINELIAERDRWFSIATSAPGRLSLVPFNGSKDRLQTAVDRIVEIERLLDKEIDRLCDLRKIILEGIAALTDYRFRRIITLKYIDGKTIEEMADEMAYSSKQVGRLHEQALERMSLNVSSLADIL